ncbi:putative holin-like toxin [Blautia coccoides]|nr:MULTISPECIES: putative holin-like toxin [Blautia]MCQ4643640.1 putative holin-like toxin [Blautia coccoides]MCQ5127099.1 putative holin-like toxin [Blautia producta]
MQIGIFEVLSLLFLSGTFLIALLTYIDRHNRK